MGPNRTIVLPVIPPIVRRYRPRRAAVAVVRLSELATLLVPLAAVGGGEPYHVLVLYSFRTALPMNANFMAGISKGLASTTSAAVEIDSESLDLSRFDDKIYVDKLKEIFRLKYR